VAAEIMTLNEVAEYLKVPVTTLYAWRTRGGPDGFPRGARVGKHVRYRKADVDKFLDSQAGAA